MAMSMLLATDSTYLSSRNRFLISIQIALLSQLCNVANLHQYLSLSVLFIASSIVS